MTLPHAAAVTPRTTRATRRSLRSERAQLLHWRRLLRARLDLAVATFAPPERLGTLTWDVLPEGHDGLPTEAELLAAVAVGVTPLDPIELMTRLRTLDQALAAYGEDLDAALEDATEHVVHHLATPPRVGD